MKKWIMATRSLSKLSQRVLAAGLISVSHCSLADEAVTAPSQFQSMESIATLNAAEAEQAAAAAEQDSTPLALRVDIGWDSKYLSEGRNNLPDSGIFWLNAAAQYGNLTTYALVGRADNSAYTEWNIGLEYALSVSEHLDANIGYQRIESFSDGRNQDNELFAEIAYNRLPWLVPAISYVYSTEAAGYFVEASLHSNWPLSERFTLTPYIIQGFDFKYVTPDHNGRNHLQFGLEAHYQLTANIELYGHLSHSLAQSDIIREAQANGDLSSQDHTYAGLHLVMNF